MFNHFRVQPQHSPFSDRLKLAILSCAFGLLSLIALSVRLSVGMASAKSAQAPGQPAQARPEEALALRQPLERKLAGGEAHRFSLALNAGQFARVVVTQEGVDVAVWLLDASGKALAGVDSPNGDAGDEALYWVAQAGRTLRVKVGTLDPKAAAGQYRIELVEVRGATAADEKRIEAQRRMMVGNQLRGQGQPGTHRQAINEFEEALKLWLEVGEQHQAAHSQLMIGWTLADLGENAEARKRCEQARRGYEEVKDQAGLAMARRILRNMNLREAEKIHMEADALRDQLTAESLRQVIARYETAARLYRDVGHKTGEALCFLEAGSLAKKLEDKQAALKYYGLALPLWRAVGKQSGEATTLNQIGLVYADCGAKQEALRYYEQALLLHREVGNRSGEAKTLNNIGAVYDALGQKQEALKYYGQALSLYRALGDRDGEATALTNIGSALNALDNKKQAIEYHRQALQLYMEKKKKGGEMTALNNLGRVYDDLGEMQMALEYYEKARSLSRESGERKVEAVTTNNICLIHNNLGRRQEALDCYLQVLSMMEKLEDTRGKANALTNICAVQVDLRKEKEALPYCQQALSLNRNVGDRDGEATTLNNIGVIHAESGSRQEALKHYLLSLSLRRVVENWRGEATTLGNIGSVLNDLNQPRGAVAFRKLSINQLQQQRGANRALGIEAQRALLRSNEDDYMLLADWLLGLGRLAEAMQAMHLARDQEFYDQAGRPGAPLVAGARPLALTQRETVFAKRMEESLDRVTPISRQLRQLQTRTDACQPSVEEAQLEQLNTTLDAEAASFQKSLTQLVEELNAAPETENRLPTTDDLSEMQQTLRTLEQRTGTKAAAIYTLIGSEDCRTLLVTADAITTASAKIKSPDLNRKIELLLQLLQSDRSDPQKPGQELYNALFKPIEPEVRKSGATLLLWSLDRSLRSLPMAALWDGKQYLAERYQHAVFTRPTPERMLREVSRTWTGQGFGTSKEWQGFSQLRGVELELQLIFGDAKTGHNSVISGQAAQDDGFTKQSFLTALKQRKPLVHIASHFSFRPGDDKESFLLLGNGEHLTLAEMKQTPDLFSGVELLTLSACNTATQRGDAQFGREVDGFAEQAQRLGAGAVMASLWEVSDAITPELMAEFYRRRQSGARMTKAAALRQAQLALLHGEIKESKGSAGKERDSKIAGETGSGPPFKRDPQRPYSHPYYWAPFILIGNWQ